MKNSVVVTGDAAGNVIMTSKNNPEYGFIRVEQSRMLVDDRGWARKKTVSALIPGKVEDLKGFDWSAGEIVEGKVTVTESLTPFNEQEPSRDLKIAGDIKRGETQVFPLFYLTCKNLSYEKCKPSL